LLVNQKERGILLSSSNFFNLQGIKVVNISGNASINPGSANISGNGIVCKVVGVSFSIGDASISNSLNNNTYFDPDVSDQNSGASPSNSSQL
jgi:hypothetical protein